MAKIDPAVDAHLEWLGFVKPTGLVVSAPALVRAGAILDRSDIEGQRLLRACVEDREFDPKVGPTSWVPEFPTFARTVLGWSFSPKGYAGTVDNPIPTDLEVPLVDYGETLRPDFAVRERDPGDGRPEWQLLVRVLDPGQDLDRVVRDGHLEASAHGRMERLLRETRVPAGLLFNGRTIRVVSAPRGESSGWLDFQVADMVQVSGRPISTALRLLLSESRLLSLPPPQRFAALLDDSRKFQNEVSERLAEQVLHALYELLRGFQAAHDASKGELLREPLSEHPDEVYRALLTVMLRLVFLLYAEERDMLPEDETFLRYYSIAGLYDGLREDAALFPDTMDQRYSAWAQLVVLFRLVYDGADAGGMHLPRRHGALFDPQRFQFLDGRSADGVAPLVPDGTIYRALDKLLVLDGERISYRALDVEQIGSVYETMMGFKLETATGRSVAIKSSKRHGAPIVIDLEMLLGEPASSREKWVGDRTDRKLTDTVKKSVKDASTLDDLHSALGPVIDTMATPDLVPRGAMVLQPSEERRRSGSHYTPRALTEPIVRTTLEPILVRLRGADGKAPIPEQILDLKVCDPAMGSGAFLVEACRQLGDALVEAWHLHDEVPAVPADEDEVIFARRLVAQRCIYGVDRNPVAVDLAKMSLWLVTLAKDHALTFLDHALRHGDSLVGLSRKQIEAFHWAPDAPRFEAGFETMRVREHLDKIVDLREQISDASEGVSDRELRETWEAAQRELDKVHLFGDLVLAAFFEGEKPKNQEANRAEYARAVVSGEAEGYRPRLAELRDSDSPLVPFHWDIEFPEVFQRNDPGFDAIVGNPPFLGGRKISTANGIPYFKFLGQAYHPAGNTCDLVAYFFRRAFDQLRAKGCLGLVATNTISQGDTRVGGLQEIRRIGGRLFSARTRYPWPGQAGVIVSIIHISKDHDIEPILLDGRPVTSISAFLRRGDVDAAPARLSVNEGSFSLGSYIYGAGFLFDDGDPDASTAAELLDIEIREPLSRARVFPYIGGEEMNEDPLQQPCRSVIYLSDLSDESELRRFPALERIVRSKVKPLRDGLGPNPVNNSLKRRWWAYQAHRPAFYARIADRARILAILRHTQAFAFTFLPTGWIYADSLALFDIDTESGFAIVQSRTHEVWSRFLCSTLGDALRYSPSDCFETFPFPKNWEDHLELGSIGKAYYDFRAALMIKRGEGLTKVYSHFHNPDDCDADIVELRNRHAGMDRATLDAYGWTDISVDCDFYLDYEIDGEDRGTKKKPYRYRWPDDVRDEVLARLLELNGQRAKEETCAAPVATVNHEKTRAKRSPKDTQTEALF
jgi:hypothetical protein